MPHPVVHFEVLGSDAEALSRFYQQTFQWDMDPVMETYSMVKPDEGSIPGGVGAAPEGSPGHVTFYIEVEDLQASLDQVAANGGSTVAPPMDVPGGPSIALFADPEGHVIGLVKSS
jgi:uncharacterized protein